VRPTTIPTVKAEIVVENNSISTVINGGKLAAQICAKMSACRDEMTGPLWVDY